MIREPGPVRRVVLVVLDGLRADAIEHHRLPNLERLIGAGAWTRRAATVRPSVTAAAMTSLFTGVPPAVHGIESDRFGVPRVMLPVVPGILAAAGIPTWGFMARVPWTLRILATRIARRLGAETSFAGRGAREILAAAGPVLDAGLPGLVVLHWPDGDVAGHADGWHSGTYRLAVEGMDRALGELWRVLEDPGTVLIACADHGGGGANPRDHDSDHPDDVTIPIVLNGARVVPGEIHRPVSLLDVPATICWALGAGRPASFVGAPLTDAIQLERGAPALSAA